MLKFAKSSLPTTKDTSTLEVMVRETDPDKLYLLLLGIVGLFTDPTKTDKDKLVTIYDLTNVFLALAVLVNEEKEQGITGAPIYKVFNDFVQTLSADNALLLGYLLEHPSSGTAAPQRTPSPYLLYECTRNPLFHPTAVPPRPQTPPPRPP